MTMVAGCVLPDGVLMTADCRISWGRLPFTVSDEAVKLVKLGDANVIGYSGDVQTVSWLMGHVFGPQLARRRLDPMSVRRWLPRFLKATYEALARRYPVQEVDFMVGGTMRSRPTQLRRTDLAGFVYQTKNLDATNWLAIRCLKEIEKDTDPIVVPDSTQGLLYIMSSPEFEPRACRGLGFAAIGSGMRVIDHMELYAPLLLTACPDRVVDVFVDALGSYYTDTSEPGVGGALLMAHLDRGRVRSLNLSEPTSDGRAEVFVQDGRFHVRNTATGQVICLRYPAEIMASTAPRRMVVDDFKNAFSQESERRRMLRTSLEREQREQDLLRSRHRTERESKSS